MVVLALPAKLAVIIPALKFPLPSLLTKVLGVLFGVAAAISCAIEAIVDELTPPILFDEAVMLDLTKAVVAICVVLVPSAGVGAVGIPVKVGDARFAFKSNAVCVAVVIFVESVNIFALKTLAVSAKEPLAAAASAFTFSAEYKPSATQFKSSKFTEFNLYNESTA